MSWQRRVQRRRRKRGLDGVGGIICTICSNKTNKSRGDSQRQRQRVEADGNIAVMTRVKEGDRAAHQMAWPGDTKTTQSNTINISTTDSQPSSRQTMEIK